MKLCLYIPGLSTVLTERKPNLTMTFNWCGTAMLKKTPESTNTPLNQIWHILCQYVLSSALPSHPAADDLSNGKSMILMGSDHSYSYPVCLCTGFQLDASEPTQRLDFYIITC